VPALKLQIKPVEMDLSIKNIILDIDGQIVRYDHGPQIPTPVTWPGPRGTGQVRVQVNPPGSGTTFGTVFEGPVGAAAPVRSSQLRAGREFTGDLPRHVRHRRQEGRVRDHREQRSQSVPAARAARLPVPDGPVSRAASSDP
jgi:hypothetical protein